MKIKAKIEKDDKGKGYWLLVDGAVGTAYPITKGEIQPIMQACIDFLVKEEK